MPRTTATSLQLIRTPLLWALLGALLIALLSQIPAHHTVAMGSWDAAYVQDFHDPEPGGRGRWSQQRSLLLFPQAGMTGLITLTLRAPDADGPVELSLLLNGRTELTRQTVGADWTTLSVAVAGDPLKLTDFFIELRTNPTNPLPDGRQVGVLLERATYRVGPGLVWPYPTQLLYGALVGMLLWALLRGGARTPALPLLLYGLIWLLFYRLEPPLYPYPLRSLPLWSVAGLGAVVLLRTAPALLARYPWLLSRLAPLLLLGGWTLLMLFIGREHVTLSRPGVENDFRVFATRQTLEQIFQADGFYNLGYPLLLWLARPFAEGNPFLAGRLVAALSGALFLASGYWMARSLLAPGPALFALLCLALSGLVGQYGLYVGSDMPFAASMALSVAALVAGLNAPADTRRHLCFVSLAGLAGGVAFLMRHPGLLLLPWGMALLLLQRRPMARPWRTASLYLLTFLLAVAPQLSVNLSQTGQLLYSQQAKNIWLAVYANTDWRRWDEVPNTIGLSEIILRDPGRFFTNWWRNTSAYLGSGAEDTSEFGRAIQLRLLTFPTNWLALAGLLAWGGGLLRATSKPRSPQTTVQTALLTLIALYLALISSAFTLPRFFLPLTPIYAVAAAWLFWRILPSPMIRAALSLSLVVVLWGGLRSGTDYVLVNQPEEERAAVAMVRTFAPDALIAVRVSARVPLAKYSAIAHQVISWPEGAEERSPLTSADLAAAQARGATYLLWDEAAAPPPLTAGAVARIALSGRYGLYRLGP